MTTAVEGPSSGCMASTTPATAEALRAMMTMSCTPASPALPASLGATVTSLPSASSLRPRSRMAARWGPRAIRVTSSPASASRAPMSPPIAPAPKTQIFMRSRVPSGQAQTLGEADALQLARGALGNLLQQHDAPRHLEIRQMAGDEVAQLPLRGLLSFAQHDS